MNNQLVDHLHKRFNEIILTYGIDVLGNPIKVGEYNNLVSESWKIEDFNNVNSLALCLASSKAIWEPFKEYLRRNPNEIPVNPLDHYVTYAINETISKLKEEKLLDDKIDIIIYYDWNENEPAHMQTMGQITGIARYVPPPVMWSIHPVFGIWFAYRAIIIFENIQTSYEYNESTVPNVLFTEDMANQMKDLRTQYPNWWKISSISRQYRNIIKSGIDIEYSEEQLQYHCISHSNHEDKVKYLQSIL